MDGITQILILLLVVSINKVSPKSNDCDLDLSQVFRTPRDFSRVNFDHFEILERNNFDQPQASAGDPTSDDEAQLAHHPKSVANAQVMLRFGGDDIHGRNRIDASDKMTPRPEYNRPGHQQHHHLSHNDMRYSPNYPSYPPHPFMQPPSPYNYGYAPPPPYYFPGPYPYPQSPSPYGLYNGQLIPLDDPKSEKPISREEDFLEFRKRKNEYENTNANRPKVLPIEDLSNDDIPKAKSEESQATPKNQNEGYIRNKVWFSSDSPALENLRTITREREEKPIVLPAVNRKYVEQDGPIRFSSDSTQSENRRNSDRREKPIDASDYRDENVSVWIPSDSRIPSDSTKTEIELIATGQKPSESPVVTEEYNENNAPNWFPADSQQSEFHHSQKEEDIPTGSPAFSPTREYIDEKVPFQFPSKYENRDTYDFEEKSSDSPIVTREYVEKDAPIRFPSDSTQSEIRHTHKPDVTMEYENNSPFGFSSDSTQPEIRQTQDEERSKDINESNEPLRERERPFILPLAQRGESLEMPAVDTEPIEFSSGPERDSSPTPIEDDRKREKPISIPPSTKERPIQLQPVKKEQPIFLRPVFKEEPISLPPVEKERPISIPPVNNEKPISIAPKPFISYKPTPLYPKYTDPLYSEAYPEKQFIEIEGWMNKSLIPCDCQKCGQKSKLLVSYPVFQEPRHRYLEAPMRVSGCPCCQRRGFCNCCGSAGSYRNPNVPFGERFPADVDSLHQVMAPTVNYRDAYGRIHLNAFPYSTGYSSAASAGYSADVSQVGNQKPRVNLDGYRSSSGLGYYSDPCKNVLYKEPTVVDVVRTPDPCRPLLEHTKIEQPHMFKVVRKYNVVPKEVTPLHVTDLLPTNVFLCQRKSPHDCKTICHREYIPEDVLGRRSGKYFPGDLIERTPRGYFVRGNLEGRRVAEDNDFLENFHASRGIHSDVPVALTREEGILRIKPVRDDYIPVRNVIEMIPTSQFLPCRRSPREAKEKIESSN